MDYTEHLKIYKFLMNRVSNNDAIRFNRIVEHKLPLGLTKTEYSTSQLVLVKNVPIAILAKECGVKEWAIQVRIKRAMKKLMCWNQVQLKEEIMRIEKTL